MSFMITQQKPVTDTLKPMRMESKHTTKKVIAPQRKGNGQEKKKDKRNSQKTIFKMAINTYVSIIT